MRSLVGRVGVAARCFAILDPAAHTVELSAVNVDRCPSRTTPSSVDPRSEREQLSTGPFRVSRSNPTHQLTDPTQPDPTQYNSLAVTYFYTQNLSRTFRQLVRVTISFEHKFLVLLL